MGTVYLALAPTGRPVALKVVKAEYAIEDGFAARFHTEVENARRVASFCTAQVLDNGNDDNGRPYMVTEYIAGTPLSRQIIEHGALEQGTLHGVALGVAAALAAIHVAGLVHRDLKPANVILSMSGPRVIDFGIARALDSTHSFTRSGEVLGSPGWWAPEQVRGLEITPAADVFAWGCMIAYAGNGRHPYGRGDMMTMATRLLTTPPDLGALPAPLNDLVRRATEMDPYQRPSAQDLLIALVGGGIAAPSAPAPVRADPPTLIATDLLNESWEPPSNVEPDSTQTLSALNLGTGFVDPATAPTPIPGPIPARRPLDPPSGPAPPSSRAVFPSALPDASGPSSGAALPSALPDPGPSSGAASSALPDPGPSSGAALPSAFPDAPGPSALDPSTTPPPSMTPTDPGGRTAPAPRRRWLFAGLAVLAALAVTVVVLLNAGLNTGLNPGGGNAAVGEGQAPREVTGETGDLAGTGDTDVGRMITTGSLIEDPWLIIPRTPTCGLTSYRDTAPARGRFCTIPFTLISTGGESVPLGDTPVTLIDDRGATYTSEEMSTAVPAVLAPGARVDGILVFDLPTARKPVKLTGMVIKEGKTIEVRL